METRSDGGCNAPHAAVTRKCIGSSNTSESDAVFARAEGSKRAAKNRPFAGVCVAT